MERANACEAGDIAIWQEQQSKSLHSKLIEVENDLTLI